MIIYGHRGARGEAPENTIDGCRHAIGLGIRHIEIDVRTAAGGELVVLHDATLLRTTGIDGRPGDFTAAELAGFDARREHADWPDGGAAGVPALDALIAATPEIAHYQLEVKPDDPRAMRAMAHTLAKRFPADADLRRFTVTSFSADFLGMLMEAAPHISRGLVAEEGDALAAIAGLDCTHACLHWPLCTPERVGGLRDAGLHVSAWTVNDIDLARRLAALPVDSIITDHPSRLLDLSGAESGVSPSARPGAR